MLELKSVVMSELGEQAFPFKIGCLPRSYSGNPGVNVDSYWETPGPGRVSNLQTSGPPPAAAASSAEIRDLFDVDLMAASSAAEASTHSLRTGHPCQIRHSTPGLPL
jgi:hypothetical protein